MTNEPMIPRNLIKHLEWSPMNSPPTQPPQNPSTRGNVPSNLDFSLSDETDFWRMTGVSYKGSIENIDLLKSLLDGGNAHTQDEWVTHYTTAAPGNGFYTPDYPLIYGIVKALYDARDSVPETAAVQTFLRDTARSKWLMTLSRIAYQPTGDDLVIHNYGTPARYERAVDFITPDEWIKNTEKPDSYQALLGTEDSVQDINTVFQWLNGTDTYAWKVNNKPATLVERVARFNADSVRSDLNCSRYPDVRNSSLGVRAQKIGGST